MKLKIASLAFAAALAWTTPALAQGLGGNTSISATTSSGSTPVQFPLAGTPSQNNFTSAIIAPAPGTAVEVFYAIGPTNAVAAISTPGSTQSASLPSGGICLAISPTAWIAAQTATSTASIRITMVSGCTQFAGGSSSGGGGGGSVTQGTNPWATAGTTAVGSAASTNPNLIGGTIDGTATGNVSMWKVVSGVGYMNCANCSGSGASGVDEAIFVPGSPTVYAPGGGFFQTTATNNALTNLQAGTVQMTAQRAYFVNLRNAAGTEIGTAATPVQVSLANTAANGTAVSVSGTVTANAGTNLNTSALATSANQPTNAGIASTTTGQTGGLTMGAVTTAAPTYTTAQTNPLSLTTSGALRVDGSAVTQPVSIATLPALVAGSAIIGKVGIDQTTVGTTNGISIAQIGANTVLTGNGVSGTGSQRVNIASDNTAFAVNATLQASSATAIGTVNPTTIGNWGLQASTQNSATPTNGGLVLGQFNTVPTTITSGNVSPLQLDSAGNLLVNIKAGASSGAVAQGSTTSGQTGGLIQGAVTTAAPTYTTAQTNPISLDTAGNLRVLVTNTNANGQAAAANSSPVVLPAAQVTADPCSLGNKINLPISQNGTSSVQLVALSGSTTIYVCSAFLMTNSTATTFAITTGTGTACVTGNAAVIGATTANIANSMNLITGAGFTLGNGTGTVAKGAASGELCMILGTNVYVSGNLTYVQL